jgi:hypothetical protein
MPGWRGLFQEEREREWGCSYRAERRKKMVLGDKGEDMSWDTGLHVHPGE